ncbi:putative (R)-mandelonitrile lyase [Rosa chinensis]|uniref:Putative (R)-mandelonitrile lyase n=1 Tax=Rosa chinensis TaxID=74649 RepID=A0A2P6RMZ0_ROSCH|nr:(R)-mandelonitrile lyase-like [Rosa chinensis]PRQ47798.1 putative (R)-mandelonitrile lyase [Rosa chinensis]
MDDFKFQGWFGNKDFRFIGPELPVDQSDFDQMADFCRRTVSTIWHYHGGCIAGKVVDGDFRVIVPLRTFGISPRDKSSGYPTLLILGRYVGQKIMNNRKGGYKMVD